MHGPTFTLLTKLSTWACKSVLSTSSLVILYVPMPEKDFSKSYCFPFLDILSMNGSNHRCNRDSVNI